MLILLHLDVYLKETRAKQFRAINTDVHQRYKYNDDWYRERMIKLMVHLRYLIEEHFKVWPYGAHVKLSLIGQRVVAAPY